MLWVTQAEARRDLGDALVLWIDPRSVDGFVGTKTPMTRRLVKRKWLSTSAQRSLRRMFKKVEPFAIPTGLFPAQRPLEETKTYRAMRSIVVADTDYRGTEWYASMVDELERNGFAVRKGREFHRREDLDRFFEEDMLGMIRSLRDIGYRSDLAPDTGTGIISSGGQVLKTVNGEHRFAAARELGVCCVPIRIVSVDRTWLRSGDGGLRREVERSNLREHLRAVEERHRSCACRRA